MSIAILGGFEATLPTVSEGLTNCKWAEVDEIQHTIPSGIL